MRSRFHKAFRFAMMGLSVTALLVVYQMLTEPGATRDHKVMIAFLVLCPPAILSALFANLEVGTNPFYFVWVVVGILNGALYATMSMVISRRRKSAQNREQA